MIDLRKETCRRPIPEMRAARASAAARRLYAAIRPRGRYAPYSISTSHPMKPNALSLSSWRRFAFYPLGLTQSMEAVCALPRRTRVLSQ